MVFNWLQVEGRDTIFQRWRFISHTFAYKSPIKCEIEISRLVEAKTKQLGDRMSDFRRPNMCRKVINAKKMSVDGSSIANSIFFRCDPQILRSSNDHCLLPTQSVVQSSLEVSHRGKEYGWSGILVVPRGGLALVQVANDEVCYCVGVLGILQSKKRKEEGLVHCLLFPPRKTVPELFVCNNLSLECRMCPSQIRGWGEVFWGAF